MLLGPTSIGAPLFLRAEIARWLTEKALILTVPLMNIAQIEEAVHRGMPFNIKVADGDEFRIPHSDYIFLPPKSSAKRTYVVVHSDEGFASVLPLLTITSLTYQVDER